MEKGLLWFYLRFTHFSPGDSQFGTLPKGFTVPPIDELPEDIELKAKKEGDENSASQDNESCTGRVLNSEYGSVWLMPSSLAISSTFIV